MHNHRKLSRTFIRVVLCVAYWWWSCNSKQHRERVLSDREVIYKYAKVDRDKITFK